MFWDIQPTTSDLVRIIPKERPRHLCLISEYYAAEEKPGSWNYVPVVDGGSEIYFGTAIRRCEEDDFGRLWVDNGEYVSLVNFCPFCGYAPYNRPLHPVKE